MSMMDRLFNKKRKKSPEPPPQGGLPGISTNIAGPVSYQAESNISPGGRESRPYQDLEADLADLIVSLDEGSGEGSLTVFQDRIGEGQEPPASGAWTSGVLSGGTEHKNDPTSKCSWSLRLGPMFM